MNETLDKRRYGAIEVRYHHRGHVAAYDLTINEEVWACVEWSPRRRAWCVQDASGRCLAHCDAIHGEHVDAETAIRLAKKLIRDGRMPTPENAAQQLRNRLRSVRHLDMGHDQRADPVIVPTRDD